MYKDKGSLLAVGKWRKQTMIFIIAVIPQCIFALGLGNISLHSSLYQTFDAEIGLVDPGKFSADNVSVSLASAEEFKRLDIDRPHFLTELKFTIVNDFRGKPFVKLSTDTAII